VNVLALDLGTTIGWALLEEDGALQVGHRTLSGEEGERYEAFRRWLSRAFQWLGRDGCVAFEDVRFNRGRSYIPGLRAVLMAECVARDVAYVGVGVSELKKWATGSGNAPKAAMVEAAGRFTDEALTEDEADAVLVAQWARDHALKGATQ